MAFETERESRVFWNQGRRNRHPLSAGYQFALALALIAFGTLLFLDNIGLLPVERIYAYWPIIPIAFGIGKLISRPTITGALWSIFFIAVGSVFLLSNLHILHIRNDGTAPLALLFVTFGFGALIKTLDGKPNVMSPRSAPGFVPWTSTDIVNEKVYMSSLKRKVESTNFQGGELFNLMGNIEFDLRSAQLPPGAKSTTIQVECIMGVIKIRVPENWKVSAQAEGILGNVEDKSIPPRADRQENAPVLVITGVSVMGNIEIEN